MCICIAIYHRLEVLSLKFSHVTTFQTNGARVIINCVFNSCVEILINVLTYVRTYVITVYAKIVGIFIYADAVQVISAV